MLGRCSIVRHKTMACLTSGPSLSMTTSMQQIAVHHLGQAIAATQLNKVKGSSN